MTVLIGLLDPFCRGLFAESQEHRQSAFDTPQIAGLVGFKSVVASPS